MLLFINTCSSFNPSFEVKISFPFVYFLTQELLYNPTYSTIQALYRFHSSGEKSQLLCTRFTLGLKLISSAGTILLSCRRSGLRVCISGRPRRLCPSRLVR